MRLFEVEGSALEQKVAKSEQNFVFLHPISKGLLSMGFVDERIIKPLWLYTTSKINYDEYWQYQVLQQFKWCVSKNIALYNLWPFLKDIYHDFMLADEHLFTGEAPIGTRINYDLEYMVLNGKNQIGMQLSHVDFGLCINNWTPLFLNTNARGVDIIDLFIPLIKTGYNSQWDVHLKTFKEQLQHDSMCGTNKSAEIHCVAIAICLISIYTPNAKKRITLMKQLSRKWGFMRYMYTIMTGYIVGLAYTTYSSVTGNLVGRRDCYQYMHLAYKALESNISKLCPAKKTNMFSGRNVSETVRDHLYKMEEIIRRTPQDDDLDELCEVLFPKKMKEVMEQERPQTYDELQQENAQQRDVIEDWKSKATALEGRVKELEPFEVLANDMREQLAHSISLETICNTILSFEYDVARNVFQLLDYQLEEEANWSKIRKELKRDIEGKRMGEKATYHNCEIYEAGAIHNDNRNQLQVTAPEAQTQQLKAAAKEQNQQLKQ